MYSIPILDNTQNLLSKLKNKNEFDLLYKLDLNDGLINPIFTPQDYATGKISSIYNESGGYATNDKMREYIFSNNYDASEEFQFTDAERMQYVQNVYNNLPEIDPLQQEINPYLNLPYDPKFRDELLNDHIKNSNYDTFHSAHDFVNEYNSGINAYNKEKNIYSGGVDSQTELLSDIKILLENTNKMNKLSNKLNEREKEQYDLLDNKYLTKLNLSGNTTENIKNMYDTYKSVKKTMY